MNTNQPLSSFPPKQVNTEGISIQTAVAPATVAVVELEKEVEKERIYKHFGKEVRLGSRKIVIKQTPKFSMLPTEQAAKTIRDEVIKKVGSKWSKDSRDIIRGLSPAEEDYYLPKVVGISRNSPEWNEKIKIFWADFGIAVPTGEGVEIEAGFKVINNPITEENNVEPLSIDGYMKYNFCLLNNDVASPEIENPFHYMFQMVDKAKDDQVKEGMFEVKKKVLRSFTQLISSDDPLQRSKIDWILETEVPNIVVSTLSPTQKEMELEKLMNNDPIYFKELINDKQLETKALIRKAVEYSIIMQHGNAFFIDNKVIGSSLPEAIGYIDNPINQKDRFIVQTKVKDFRK